MKNLTIFGVGSAALLTCSIGYTAEETPGPGSTVSVQETFDGVPFSYQVRSVVAKSGFSVHYLSYPSPIVTDIPRNNTIPAELFLPSDHAQWQSPRPVVICMHILDGNFELVRMTCSVLASRGIPAIMFKLPYYGERAPAEGTRSLARRPRRFVDALVQSESDIRRTVDLLASRAEIDADHIGITGISLGGIVAATATAKEPRLRRAMLILSGGDIATIIHHAEETRPLSETIAALPQAERDAVDAALRTVDPLTHASQLQARARDSRILMVNAAEDEVVPRNCTDRLAEALGLVDDVVWLEGLGHYTAMAAMPRTLQRTVQFFGQDLPADTILPEPPTPPATDQIALDTIRQAATLLGNLPNQDKCHVVDLKISVTDAAGTEWIEGQIYLALAHDGRFKVDARNASLGRIAFGAQPRPWLLAQRTLMLGDTEPNADAASIAILTPDDLAKIRTVAGALNAATFAPGVFQQFFVTTQGTTENDRTIIHVARRDRSSERLRLTLAEDLKSVRRLEIEWADGRADVEINAFQPNAPVHDALFRPADADKQRTVSTPDLLEVFRAAAAFAMQQLTRQQFPLAPEML